jgi:hypothetical protein
VTADKYNQYPGVTEEDMFNISMRFSTILVTLQIRTRDQFTFFYSNWKRETDYKKYMNNT